MLILLFILAFVLSSPALTQNASPNLTPLDNEKRIVEAERTADLNIFNELLSDTCITIGPDGHRHPKSEILQILRSIPPQQVTASDFVVLPAGRDAAIVNYVVTSVMPNGSIQKHTASSVWVRQRKGWFLLFHQGTNIPQQP
jgi:hypothetical protein